MSTMTTVASLNYADTGPYTVADLDRMPDDGRRHELIDGLLIVSPAPRLLHQRAVTRLLVALADACTPGFEVLPAPFDVRLSNDTNLEPDVLVARVADLTQANLPVPPVLAVEVLSPSTAAMDRTLKKATYERFGVENYWIVDPDQKRPSLTAYSLGSYGSGVTVVVDEQFRAAEPFPIEIRPRDLVRS